MLMQDLELLSRDHARMTRQNFDSERFEEPLSMNFPNFSASVTSPISDFGTEREMIQSLPTTRVRRTAAKDLLIERHATQMTKSICVEIEKKCLGVIQTGKDGAVSMQVTN